MRTTSGAEERPASFGRRLALTLVLPLVFLIGERVPAPGLTIPAEDFTPSFSIFALGLTPILSASVLVELAALAVPAWRALRHDWPKGRAKLERAALLVATTFVALQAFGIGMMLGSAGSESPVIGSSSPGTFVVSLVAGFALLLWIAHTVTRQGISNGIVVITLLSGLEPSAQDLVHRFRAGDPGRVSTDLLPGIIVLAIVVLGSYLALSPRAAEPRAFPTLPVPSSSLLPVWAVAAVVALPFPLGTLGVPGASDVAEYLELPRLRALVFLTLTPALGAALTFLLNRPRDVARHLHPGEADDEGRRTEATVAIRRSLVPSSLLLLTLVAANGTAHEVGWLGMMLVPVLVAAVLDARVAVRAWAIDPGLVCVRQEQRPYAVPALRECLRRAGIDAHVFDSAQTTLLRFLAPFVATRICVPAPMERRARKLLRQLVREEQAVVGERVPDDGHDVHEPRAPLASPSSGWIARARTPLLAAAALASMACWAFARPPSVDIDATRAPPVSLEVVLVDDGLDPFAGLDASTLPAGAAVFAAGSGAGGEHAPRSWVRLVPQPGESLEQAMRRVEPWWRGLGLPPDVRVAWSRVEVQGRAHGPGEAVLASYVLRGRPVLRGWDVASARADSQGGQSASLVVELTPEGGDRFEAFTRAHVGARLAILIDGHVEAAPMIKAAIPGGVLTIDLPGASEQDARSLAAALSARVTVP